MIRSRSLAILVCVLVAAVAFVAAELVVGATRHGVEIVRPCAQRAPFPGSAIDATIQRVVLQGLDGAACRLGTTREELVLSLDGKGRWDTHTIEAAVRAGLVQAVDKAGQRGDIPGFLVPLVRAAVERAPLAALLRGAINLRSLIG